MKSIQWDDRRKNLGHFVANPRNKTRAALGLQDCPTCANSGFVVVLRRPTEPCVIRPKCQHEGDYEEMGPCPYCQAGHTIEFPVEGTGMWPDGYWAHQQSIELEQAYKFTNEPLSIEENRRRWREFIGGKTPQIAEDIAA